MAAAKLFCSITLRRNEDPKRIVRAFGDQGIFALTRDCYLPMSDGVCRPHSCRTDNFEEHYQIYGVGIYQTPLAHPILITNTPHRQPSPLRPEPRPEATPLSKYRTWLDIFWSEGGKLQRSLERLKLDLYNYFTPLIKLAEDSLSFDLHKYGLSLDSSRHPLHQKFFRQILNSEVDISACLKETFRFIRKTPLQDASLAKNLWPLRHALSTIKTILRCLSQSIKTLETVMGRVSDIRLWVQDHGHRSSFQNVKKASPLFLDQFFAKDWYEKILAFWERTHDEWKIEIEGTRRSVPLHSDREVFKGLERKLSSDTLNSLSHADDRERRPYTHSGLARKASTGHLGRPSASGRGNPSTDLHRTASVKHHGTSSTTNQKTPSAASSRTASGASHTKASSGSHRKSSGASHKASSSAGHGTSSFEEKIRKVRFG